MALLSVVLWLVMLVAIVFDSILLVRGVKKEAHKRFPNADLGRSGLVLADALDAVPQVAAAQAAAEARREVLEAAEFPSTPGPAEPPGRCLRSGVKVTPGAAPLRRVVV